ncbi:MAG: hypothetical protein M0Q29_12155 [Thiopseudomonas sp.]|nr:hypothetical protein [Thiopseudomonas sp.]
MSKRIVVEPNSLEELTAGLAKYKGQRVLILDKKDWETMDEETRAALWHTPLIIIEDVTEGDDLEH